MKVKDIIKIQNAIHEATDFIDTNSDSDNTNVGKETMNLLNEAHKILQLEKERIYLNNALKKARKKRINN